jgi:hypothetical protein
VRQELTVLYQRHVAVESAKKRLNEEFEEPFAKELEEKLKTILNDKEEKELSDE